MAFTLPLEPRWRQTLAAFTVADAAAFRLLLQAPWPTATDAIETDDALQLVARALPEHDELARRVKDFDAQLEACPEAADTWGQLHGDLLAHVEETALLLGLALGARLGPAALKVPAGVEDAPQEP